MSVAQPQSSAPDRKLRVDLGPTADLARSHLINEYVSTLALPPDDMWSAFADQADPVAFWDGDELIGFAAIDNEGELHRWYLRSGHESLGSALLDLLSQQRTVTSMIAATTDPGALTALLPRAGSQTPVAMLYHHEVDPVDDVLDGLRAATEADQSATVAFVADSTGGPLEFLEPYVGERIDRRELYLHAVDGAIAGVGERRVAQLGVGHAHLGIIVGHDHRSRGLGGALMNSLVQMCRRQQLTALCSTEPDNIAAQRLMHRAGFRSRHTIFRLNPAGTSTSFAPSPTT